MSHGGFIENHHGNQRPLKNLPLSRSTRGDRGGDAEERAETGGVMVGGGGGGGGGGAEGMGWRWRRRRGLLGK